MNVLERVEFLDAMREAGRLIMLTQEALSRARSQCHGEVYEQVHSMTKHFYELRMKSERLRNVALRRVELPLRQADAEGLEAGV